MDVMKVAVGTIFSGLLSIACAAHAPAPDLTVAPEPQASPPSDIEPVRVGSVERQKLLEVLDRGIGRFLGTLDVEAVFVAEQFAGWRVLRHENSGIDVRVGDVILAVNGVDLRTPDDLAELWRSLRQAAEIEVELARDNKRVALRFAIADS